MYDKELNILTEIMSEVHFVFWRSSANTMLLALFCTTNYEMFLWNIGGDFHFSSYICSFVSSHYV